MQAPLGAQVAALLGDAGGKIGHAHGIGCGLGVGRELSERSIVGRGGPGQDREQVPLPAQIHGRRMIGAAGLFEDRYDPLV